MTPENPPKRDEAQPAVKFYGLAQRAGAILRRMEQCSPLALRIKQQSSLSTASDTRLVDDNSKEVGECKSEGESDGDDRLGNANLAEESYQGVYSDFPRHLASLKYALPTPTRSIYNMVLKSYAKELGPIHIAQEAEDVIWSMIVRAMQLQTSQNESNDDGDKRALSLTSAGLEETQTRAERIAAIMTRLAELGQAESGAEAQNRRQALRRLRHISKIKLEEQSALEAEIFGIITKAISEIEAL